MLQEIYINSSAGQKALLYTSADRSILSKITKIQNHLIQLGTFVDVSFYIDIHEKHRQLCVYRC